MNRLFLLLLFTSYIYAYVDDSALTTLQTLDHWNTFRIILPHTADECFYLEAKLHDTIHVVYQVLKGGDSNVRTIITDPLGNITFSSAMSPFGWYDEESAKVAGIYQLCFKNEQYFTTKTIYIGVLAVHKDLLVEANINTEKENKDNETEAIEEFSATAMKSLGDISSTLYRLTAYQTVARVHDVYDLYWVEANESYVQNWAICQILAMILCSIIQVFSIRRLFISATPQKKSSYNQNFRSQSSPHFLITS
ncbi:hypothetical protein I4U23_018444 [Adineta vaga]|nr:hypothetical protein I4U23_018444 [Adineta vaga]